MYRKVATFVQTVRNSIEYGSYGYQSTAIGEHFVAVCSSQFKFSQVRYQIGFSLFSSRTSAQNKYDDFYFDERTSSFDFNFGFPLMNGMSVETYLNG